MIQPSQQECQIFSQIDYQKCPAPINSSTELLIQSNPINNYNSFTESLLTQSSPINYQKFPFSTHLSPELPNQLNSIDCQKFIDNFSTELLTQLSPTDNTTNSIDCQKSSFSTHSSLELPIQLGPTDNTTNSIDFQKSSFSTHSPPELPDSINNYQKPLFSTHSPPELPNQPDVAQNFPTEPSNYQHDSLNFNTVLQLLLSQPLKIDQFVLLTQPPLMNDNFDGSSGKEQSRRFILL